MLTRVFQFHNQPIKSGALQQQQHTGSRVPCSNNNTLAIECLAATTTHRQLSVVRPSDRVGVSFLFEATLSSAFPFLRLRNCQYIRRNMSEQTYKFHLAMTCEGCSNAAKKTLGKLGDKVSNVDINVENKTVVVTTSLSKDEILETLKKTGKAASFIE